MDNIFFKQKQILTSLQWIDAFLQGTRGYTARVFDLDHFRNSASTLEMVFDACSWGLGGILLLDSKIVSYFASVIDEHDVEILGITRGSSVDQQLCESLCMLVGLRLWAVFGRTAAAHS